MRTIEPINIFRYGDRILRQMVLQKGKAVLLFAGASLMAGRRKRLLSQN